MFIDSIHFNFDNMFKKPKVVTLAPSSEHDDYPYGSPWVTSRQGRANANEALEREGGLFAKCRQLNAAKFKV